MTKRMKISDFILDVVVPVLTGILCLGFIILLIWSAS